MYIYCKFYGKIYEVVCLKNLRIGLLIPGTSQRWNEAKVFVRWKEMRCSLLPLPRNSIPFRGRMGRGKKNVFNNFWRIKVILNFVSCSRKEVLKALENKFSECISAFKCSLRFSSRLDTMSEGCLSRVTRGKHEISTFFRYKNVLGKQYCCF